jgi:hypothetical protein
VINGPSPAITTNGPVTYTITYRPGTSNFVSVSLDLGTNGITTNSVGTTTEKFVIETNSLTSYTLLITNIAPGADGGTLGFSIAAGTAVDYNGNPAPAAGPSVPVLVVGSNGLATTIGLMPSSLSLTNLSLTLDFHGGVAGAIYDVQSTTNLATNTIWQFAGTMTNNAAANGSLVIHGAFITNVPAQFYRAILQIPQ